MTRVFNCAHCGIVIAVRFNERLQDFGWLMNHGKPECPDCKPVDTKLDWGGEG